MKVYLTCFILTALGLFAAGLQMGLFGDPQGYVEREEDSETVVEKKPATIRAPFPAALAPAAKTEPVAVAAAFEPADRPHKMVFFDTKGALHAWHAGHEGYNEEWWTERVEEAELVVVVGAQRKLKISFHKFDGGPWIVTRNGQRAPPITRYQYELEASIIEAKTGVVLANRSFHNVPRPIRARESWETTALGAPVSYHTVFRWAAGIAKFGPPNPPIHTPIVVQLKD